MTPVIGIIGGMGPWASIYMLQLFYRESRVQQEQEYPRILVDSNPRVPDRTRAILGEGEDPFPYFLASARGLVAQGAEMLVMACNTAHYWHARLTEELDAPFPSLISCAVDAALQRGLKPGDVLGLMATDGLLASGLYQEEIEDKGLVCRLPDAGLQNVIMEAIYGPTGIKLQGAVSPGSGKISEVVQHLLDSGCGTVIAACTELPVGLGDNPLARRTIDPMLATVRHVLRTANYKKQEPNHK
ncbi:aspartate/glutamate racemase family protein [Planctomycetota bacterium]